MVIEFPRFGVRVDQPYERESTFSSYQDFGDISVSRMNSFQKKTNHESKSSFGENQKNKGWDQNKFNDLSSL